MKSTPSPRFPLANKTKSLFLLTLVSLVAAAALLSFAVSANKANRAAKARAEQVANTKSAINPTVQNDKQPNAPTAAVIVAALSDNTAAATKVTPGSTINYTATITNNGAASPADDATNLNFSAPLDANTTLVGGSVHASPLAFNDTYNWVGNTQLDTVARALPAVTANDVAVNAPAGTDTFTLTAIAGGATALGGVVTLASPSGSFVYTPPLGRPNIGDGATAQDSFTYTITNSADPTLTSIGTVRINLTGRVWYLVAGGVGDGRTNTPSGSPAAMSTAADKGTDFFYIFSNAGNLNGPFSLDAGQQLLGQGVNLVVSAITLFTTQAPTPTTTNTAGSCVSLAGAPGNNTLSGFNIGNCTGGTAITGANVGTLNVSTVSINTNGGALDLTGVGAPTISVVLGGTTSTGGTKNVNLVGLNGTITLAGGALSGATGNSFDVSGGTAAITYSGTISNSGAKQVNVANKTGGSVALSGAVGGTGTGINLTTNTGATISFTGGIAISSGANAAFNATGGGTVSATQNNTTIVNTLTTTTGTALNVANTTIGASGLTFRNVAVSGNNTLPTNGIILNATGANGLKVTGNGGACTPATPTCTGGTIQGTGSHGVSLTGVSNIEFNLMSIHNTGDHGIFGDGVNNFTLRDSRIFSFGNTAGAGVSEDAMHFESTNTANTAAGHGLTGTVIIQRDNIGPDSAFVLSPFPPLPENKGIVIRNHNDLDFNMTVTGTRFFQLSNDGIDADVRDETDATAGHGTGTINVDGSTADGTNIFSQINGRAVNFQNAVDNAAARIFDLTIKNNTFDHTGIGGRWLASGRATMNARYTNNTMTVNYDDAIRAESDAVNAALTPHAYVNATVTNNTMGGGSTFISLHRQAVMDINYSNNTNIGGTAAGSGGCAACTGVHTGINLRSDRGSALRADIQGNTGQADGSLAFAQSALDLQATTNGGGNSTICANIGGAVALKNTLSQIPDTAGQQVISIDPVGGSTITIQGGPGGSPGTENFLIANNTLNGTNKVAISTPGAVPSGIGVDCLTVAPPIPPPSDEAVRNRINVVGQQSLAAMISEAASEEKQVTPVVQISSKDGIASVLAKVTPKASAAEVARIYRSERPISHHAVRKNAFSQEPNAPTAGEIVTLNTIATFPAGGKSITIKYSATVNTTALTARQATTQGTITANAGAINVVTTDPGPPAAGATVTLLDTTITWTGATNTDWNDATNWNRPGPVVSSYAPGVSNPAVNDVVIPNVGAQPNISATDIGIFSLNISNGRTLTITNPRILTIGSTTATGGDLTLDGIISGGFLNFGNGTHAINNAGGTGSLSSTNVATVLSGGSVTLNNNLQAGALGVNAGGSMTIANRTLSLNGTGGLVVPGGATFTTTGSTVIFNGTAAQQAAGIAYNNLTINNTIGTNVTGVTLTGNATVNGVLALTSSDLATGAFTLTQPNTTASTGVSDVVGTVIRSGGPFGLISLTFGNPNNIITFTGAGTRPTTMTVVLAKAAPATFTTAVQRNFTMSQTGGAGFTATVRLHYLDTELNGNTPEANLGLRRFRTADSHWVAAPPPPGVPTRDGAANWIEATGVLAADLTTQWTFSTLAPTASDGSVTGRIVDQSGNPVEGAVVRLEGTQNRKFITDANGFYRFDNVETNGFYTVTPARANYSFTPQVRSFSQIGESTEAAFGATLTTSTLANPLDTPEYFVRQHYVDFLNREPDEAGFNFWSDQIIECGLPSNIVQNCIERRRENVSAAFFLSIEFQKTGGLVDGLYRAAYGVRPDFAHFLPDTRTAGLGVQVGKDGWEALLAANTEAFVNNFVNRAEFHAAYDNLSNADYVDTLISHTGVSFTSAERDPLLSGLGAGSMTRAEALRSIAENRSFVNAKFNETFVMMEYFGYLRRDADASGFAFWLNKLNQFNGNFEQAEMVKAFIVSGEYRDRFPR